MKSSSNNTAIIQKSAVQVNQSLFTAAPVVTSRIATGSTSA
jgi:hypothetical protein